MDGEESSRIRNVKLLFSEIMDKILRFVRPSWLNNLFMMVYTIMVVTLLLMLYLLVSYLFQAPETDMIYNKNTEDPIIKPRTLADPSGQIDPLLAILYVLSIVCVLCLVVWYGGYRRCAGSGLHYQHAGYEQI